MPIPADLEAFHREQAEIARERYSAGVSWEDASQVWLTAKADFRKRAADTLAATRFLQDIESAIRKSAGHMSVLRRALSPPMSQDQFALLCSHYSKARENSGGAIAAEDATAIAAVVLKRRDREITKWLDEHRDPTAQELRLAIESISLLMAAQSALTNQRTTLAAKQEAAVIEMLAGKGWTQKAAPLIDRSAQLSVHEFMHKTRFATKVGSQEVDVACGLGNVILAMECKVTNDATNSVKRINDVLKKAKAWQDHWGNFVLTAALLQGVIAYKDVRRLLEDGVVVFWSHRLADLSEWLDDRVKNG